MDGVIAVIFVSRCNSLHSVLAHSCLEAVGKQRFKAYWCGEPGNLAKSVHEAAVRALSRAGMPLRVAKPLGWSEFERSGAPRFDFVITLDESVLPLEPRWNGQPTSALWTYPDIAAEDHHAEDLLRPTSLMLHSLRRRLELLANLPFRTLDRGAIRSDLRDLAYLP